MSLSYYSTSASIAPTPVWAPQCCGLRMANAWKEQLSHLPGRFSAAAFLLCTPCYRVSGQLLDLTNPTPVWALQYCGLYMADAWKEQLRLLPRHISTAIYLPCIPCYRVPA